MPTLIRALVVVSLVAAACGTDDGGGDAPTTSSGPTTTESSTTTTGPPAEGVPDQLVAVTSAGDAVVLDAENGSELRTLLSGISIQPAKNDVTVSPDGSTAYVVRPAPGEEPVPESDIVSVPTEGGEAETIAQGLTPSVSPDGETLAYVAVEDGEGRQPPVPVLVLRDLASDEERRLRREAERDFTFVADTAWADGDTVVFVAGEIQTGLYAVDVGAGSLDEARRLGPDEGREETSWDAVTPYVDDQVAVVETCCDVGEKERWGVTTVRFPSGEERGSLFADERVEATRLDADPGADALLLVVRDGPEGGTLQRWDGDGAPVTLTPDVVVAAW